ncbi:hypothetical protein CRI69_17420 [Escherichia sp. E4742]|nr:hypothetical protein CRI69_17420 [Escherichia sp. E4742]
MVCDADASYPAHSIYLSQRPLRQHLLPLLFIFSAVLLFIIPYIYLANIYQCDRFLSCIYSNA